jgi:large subunit ribosomal protein L24
MIKKGDKVIVTTGKDKGKTGTVESVFPKISKAIVGGLNISKRHLKSRRANGKSAIVDVASPIHVSNLKKADK